MLIRPAEAKDKKQVLEMTKETWDDGDYIINVFDKWLEAPGEFTVLEDQGEIVGCAKISIIKPNHLWLEGIRVDPTKRRKGYAKILADYQLDYCKKLGFDHLNLSTYYQNESVRMLENYPFEIIHKYKALFYSQQTTYDSPDDNTVSFDDVIQYFATMVGNLYYACDWTFFTLDEHMLKMFFNRGEIFLQGSDYVIVSDLFNKDNSLSLVFANQVNDQLMSLINYLMTVKEKDYISAMVYDEYLVKLFMEKGFEEHDDEKLDVYLYEYQDA